MSDKLTTDLARAKGVGSAKSGAKHWLYQRVTAIILAICSVWLIFFIKCIIGRDISHFVAILQKPYNIAIIGILVIVSFYHSMLGMNVVIEDYISCIKFRIGLIIVLQIFCITTIAFFVVALFHTQLM
jgi:succinate dehydrogenase / fumarate reductase membrane anchor subunit